MRCFANSYSCMIWSVFCQLLAIILSCQGVTLLAFADNVQITVFQDRQLSINGSTTLHRDAYFNIHGSPGELNQAERDYLIGELGVSFGRSMGGLSSTFRRFGEDSNRPGYLNTQALIKAGRQRRAASQVSRKVAPTYTLVESAHPYAYFRRPKNDADSERFVPQGNAAIAEAVTAYFKARRDTGIAYFEPANEANVHLRELGVSWEEVCKLHRDLAKHLHKEIPWLKVGGPSSAYPAFEINDFELWNRHMRPFIKTAAADLDFLSIHLYTTHWDDKRNDRFGGNTDAILDLMENQSLLDTGVVKPLLISECGAGIRKGEKIFDEYSPERDGKIIAGANHMLMTLIKRDDRLLKMIPFIVLKATWWDGQGPYPWCLFHKVDGQWEYTHLLKWYQLWQGVAGEHLASRCTSPNVQVHAVSQGKTLYLCVDNLNQVETPFKIDFGSDELQANEIHSVEVRRLAVDGPSPQLAIHRWKADQPNTEEISWRQGTLAPEEAMVLKITLKDISQPREMLVEKTHYGQKTLQPIEGRHPAVTMVPVDKESLRSESATLRLGISRNRELKQTPVVRINGKRLNGPMQTVGNGQTNYRDQFTTREFDVPVAWLSNQNHIAVSFPADDSDLEVGFKGKPLSGRLATAVLVTRRATSMAAIALKQERLGSETN